MKPKSIVLDWFFHATKLFNCFATLLAHPLRRTYVQQAACPELAVHVPSLVPHEKLFAISMFMHQTWCCIQHNSATRQGACCM